METNNIPVAVGQRYTSFVDLERAVNEWGQSMNTVFCKGQASKLQTVVERHPAAKLTQYILSLSDPIATMNRLKYHKVCFMCCHGGRPWKQPAGHVRVRTRCTRKVECPVRVYALCVRSELVIQIIQSEHNHSVNEENFRMQPEMRRLQPVARRKVAEFYKGHSNPKKNLTLLSEKELCLRDDQKLLKKKVIVTAEEMKAINTNRMNLVETERDISHPRGKVSTSYLWPNIEDSIKNNVEDKKVDSALSSDEELQKETREQRKRKQRGSQKKERRKRTRLKPQKSKTSISQIEKAPTDHLNSFVDDEGISYNIVKASSSHSMNKLYDSLGLCYVEKSLNKNSESEDPLLLADLWRKESQKDNSKKTPSVLKQDFQCVKCTTIYSCPTVFSLITHLQDAHKVSVDTYSIVLNSFGVFDAWKRKQEELTHTCFVQASEAKSTTSEVIHYYFCKWFQTMDGKNIAQLETSEYDTTYCSAHIMASVSKLTGKVSVEYCLDHIHRVQAAGQESSHSSKHFIDSAEKKASNNCISSTDIQSDSESPESEVDVAKRKVELLHSVGDVIKYVNSSKSIKVVNKVLEFIKKAKTVLESNQCVKEEREDDIKEEFVEYD